MFRLRPRRCGAIVDQSELLSGLIGDIYDAALDPSLWTDVAGKAAQFVGGLSGTLFSQPVAGRGVSVNEQP